MSRLPTKQSRSVSRLDSRRNGEFRTLVRLPGLSLAVSPESIKVIGRAGSEGTFPWSRSAPDSGRSQDSTAERVGQRDSVFEDFVIARFSKEDWFDDWDPCDTPCSECPMQCSQWAELLRSWKAVQFEVATETAVIHAQFDVAWVDREQAVFWMSDSRQDNFCYFDLARPQVRISHRSTDRLGIIEVSTPFST